MTLSNQQAAFLQRLSQGPAYLRAGGRRWCFSGTDRRFTPATLAELLAAGLARVSLAGRRTTIWPTLAGLAAGQTAIAAGSSSGETPRRLRVRGT